MQIDKIRINMLGGFSVWVHDHQIMDESAKLTKPWQLFCYLVLHREKYIPSTRLISVLWADDVLTDSANVLKNAVYSLRKELMGNNGSTNSPILYSDGGYRFNPLIELDLDVDRFTRLYQEAIALPESAPNRMEAYKNAHDAYHGDFLPQLKQDLWVVPLALEFRRNYMDIANRYAQLLWDKKEFREVLSIMIDANKADPVDEKTTLRLFQALEALNMYRVIITTYSRTLQNYNDLLGSTPPEEVERIYTAASDRVNKTEQDIILVKTELECYDPSPRPQRGPYFCSYTTLKHLYPMLKRSSERSNMVLVLALFTLAPKDKENNAEYDLTRAMEEFRVVAVNTLRKNDSLSRYSKNQYVMLLMVSTLEDSRLIRNRIRENFASSLLSRKIDLDVKLTEV